MIKLTAGMSRQEFQAWLDEQRQKPIDWEAAQEWLTSMYPDPEDQRLFLVGLVTGHTVEELKAR